MERRGKSLDSAEKRFSMKFSTKHIRRVHWMRVSLDHPVHKCFYRTVYLYFLILHGGFYATTWKRADILKDRRDYGETDVSIKEEKAADNQRNIA